MVLPPTERRVYAERRQPDSRHQWLFMLMFEVSAEQAGLAQGQLDAGELPDPVALNGSMVDVPRVFCWRCLQPFDEEIARQPCTGDERRRHARRAPASVPARPRRAGT